MIGCGGNGVPVVPVSGQVTFDGGECPAAGFVSFQPIEVPDGLPRRAGSAKFGTDGKFIVTSFKDGDGLVPGEYRASVTCESGLPDPTSPTPWEDITYIAENYEPEEIVVEEGSSAIMLSLDVPRKQK